MLAFRFELVSVSENYGDYLAALEIPAYLIYFIQSSAESMIFEVIGDSWRWEIDKGKIKSSLFNSFNNTVLFSAQLLWGIFKNVLFVRYVHTWADFSYASKGLPWPFLLPSFASKLFLDKEIRILQKHNLACAQK